MNTTGRIFRVGIYGESHGEEVGVVIDGVPAGIPLGVSDFTVDLKRRKGGSRGTTRRREPDLPRIRSGIFRKHTTGRPLTISFLNRHQRSGDYTDNRKIPRPGHTDWVAARKYFGYHDYRGGGAFSGRLSLGLVAAGVVAKKILRGVSFDTRLAGAGGALGEEAIARAVVQAEGAGDSLGGVVGCRVTGVPAGLGEPFFDSVESLISHGLFSIPGVKGIEFGSGFGAAEMPGSIFNDALLTADGRTATNHAGGINGGITNGNDLTVQVAFRPAASISRRQRSVNLKTGRPAHLRISGRHDVCFALRCPVIVEAVVAMVLADLVLIRRSQNARNLRRSL